MTQEEARLAADREHHTYWKRWGLYLSERQWGIVREDYSANGSAWEYFPHDHARSRTYRWGEDDIAGISDTHQRLCFAIALWNGEDAILKERLFGLSGNEGNHGEDVKEYYFYLDKLPDGGYINQADGTSWMGMYCLNMLEIALELAQNDSTYEDIASKFFEHFLYIASAINGIGEAELSLWDETDGFYYDALHLPDGQHFLMRVRSVVGLAPLFAVAALESEMLERFPGFKRRTEWFMQNRPDLTQNVICLEIESVRGRTLLAISGQNQLRRILHRMLDENEFLSPYGIRSLSKFYAKAPYVLRVHDHEYRVSYEPAVSETELFGGNSNWRGPVWLPINYLMIESLQKYHHYLGEAFKVECPTGSGQMMTLRQVATELSQRLVQLFLNDATGQRPVYGGTGLLQTNPHWHDLI